MMRMRLLHLTIADVANGDVEAVVVVAGAVVVVVYYLMMLMRMPVTTKHYVVIVVDYERMRWRKNNLNLQMNVYYKYMRKKKKNQIYKRTHGRGTHCF